MAAQHHRGSECTSENGTGVGSKQSKAVEYQWREDQVEKFVYLIRLGEEKRQWILNDYEFEDPYNSTQKDTDNWPKELEDRLRKFEGRSNSLVREMYHRKGWVHSSDHGANSAMVDDFWSDSDSDTEDL